jgi:succinate dehydrogenase / fumarate reductase, cytochrome b subunit
MSTAINPKGPRVYKDDATPQFWLSTYLGSSVGQKIVAALTGLGLVTFVVFHMIGNWKLFHGPASINAYAHFLKHDLGALIWIARGGLLGIFALHLAMTIWLKTKTSAARPIPYVSQKTAQATIASQTMLSTGIVIGFFVLFHLAHFTFAWAHDADLGEGRRINYLDLKEKLPDGKERHDVYSMVVAGFKTPWISGLYIAAMFALAVHLSHGIKSSLQTIGLVGRRFTPAASALAYSLAAFIFIGNVAIVLAVWLGMVAPIYPMAK